MGGYTNKQGFQKLTYNVVLNNDKRGNEQKKFHQQ